jgi:hypothetical protein
MKGKLGSSLLTYAVAIVASAALATSVKAAGIAWGPATNISSDSDVSLEGTLVSATQVNTTGAPITVNTVTFGVAGSTPNFVYSTDLLFAIVPTSNSPLTFEQSSPATGGSAAYNALVNEDVYNVNLLELQRLNVGQEYLVQIWADNGVVSPTPDVPVFFDPSLNGVGLIGAAGQYVIGTFTADAASEIITVGAAEGHSIVSAVQLRAIPEPASLSVLGVGAMALMGRRRRKA